MFFVWNPIAEAVNCGCMGKLGSLILSGTMLVSHIFSSFRDFQIPFFLPSSFLSFFFSFHFFFCALFLPCIPPLKSHWCSGSAPSQAGKPMLVLQCPLPQILCLHRVTWMPSLTGLTLIFPYLSLSSSLH